MIILKKKHKNSLINIIKGTSTTNDNDCQLIELNKTINNNGNYTYTPIGDIIGYNKVNITVDVPQEIFETEDKNITITENGTTTVTPSSGYDGLSSVGITVDVPQQEPIELQSKNVTITENGTTTVVPSTGYDGMTEVSITTDVKPNLFSFEEELTTNGEYSYSVNFPNSPYYGFGDFKIDVNVQPTLQTLNYNVNRNGNYDIIPTDGFNAIGNVRLNVNVPKSQYDLITELGYTIDENTISNNSLDNNIDKSILLSKTVPNDFNNYWLTNTVPTLRFFPKIDTSNINNFSGLFKNMSCLVYIPRLTINSNCTDLEMTFGYCYNLDNIDTTNWNVSNVLNMKELFYNCCSLSSLDLTNLDMSNVKSLESMFWYCKNLIEIKGLNKNLPNLTNISSVFYNCTSLLSLDLSNWNTSNISSLESIFYNCRSLTSLNLSGWIVSNVTNIHNLFSGCHSLMDLNLSSWDLINCSKINMFVFSGCIKLTNFQAPKNINAEISFSDCNKLTVDSLLSILNNLTNRNGTTSMKCYIGSTNLAKLTDEQKAIATNKNWILS